MTTTSDQSSAPPAPASPAPWWYEIGSVDPLPAAARATNRIVHWLAVLVIVAVALGGAFAWHSDKRYASSITQARTALVQAQSEQNAARERLAALTAETRAVLDDVGAQVDRPALLTSTATTLTTASAVLDERPDGTPVRSVTLATLSSGAAAARAHRDRAVEVSQALEAQMQSLRVSHDTWLRAHPAATG